MPKEDSLSLFPEVEDITQDLTNEQFGELMRAMFAYYYRGEAYDGKDPMVRMGFRFVSSQLDRREAAKKAKTEAAQRRWKSTADADPMQSDADPMQSYAQPMQNDAQGMQSDADPMQSCTDHMQSDAPILSYPIHSYPILSNKSKSKAGKQPAPSGKHRKSFGVYGWVKLTDEEYHRLLNDLGEAEVKRCIAYVDESAQSTGNKNKWRDWNLVIRKCSRDGWGGKSQAQPGTRQLDDDERAAIARMLGVNGNG